MAMALQIRMMDMGSAHHNGTTIHSGHYMMSCLDETSDDTDYYGYTTATEPEYLHDKPQDQQEQCFVKQDYSNRSSAPSTDAKTSCFIENNLAELLQYMTLTYNGTLPSPKWKDFKGIKLKLRQKIRLNNIIWREWHMQYIKFKNPVVCQFDVPTSDRTHNKPEAVVLEGKYCKRRLESLAVEYSRWRLFAKQKRLLIKNEKDMQKKFLRESGQLDSFMSMFQSFEDDEAVRADNESDNKRLDFSNDLLFTSLAQPFAFPCVKEIAAEARNYFSSEMIVQPGLIQLQPNLPENLASYEMKTSKPLENCQKVSRRNPILSSLLMGPASSSSSYVSGLVPDKPPMQSAVSALPLLSNQGQVMDSKSSNVFLSSPELIMPSFSQFSNQAYSLTDDTSYLPNISSPISMTFIQQDLQPEISTISFGCSSVSYPSAPPTSTTHPSQTNHLRALLQGTSDYKFQKDEGLSRCLMGNPLSNSSVLPLPTKRRKSTGQPIPGPSSHQVCNKSIQRLIDSDRQDGSCRRASTGTLSSTDALMLSGSEMFAVPQKVQKVKSHSVGSPLPHRSPQMSVRRRKTSCIARGSLQVNFLDEDTEVLVGNSSSSINRLGSPAIGVSCPQAPDLVTDVDQSPLWDMSLMSNVQPLQGNCHFESDHFDCEMSNSSSNSMNTSQLVSAVCGVGDMGRTSNSMSHTSGTVLHHQCSSEDCGSLNDELNEFRMGPKSEHDRQQPQQHVEQRRVLHLSSEQKRRVSINSGFERLEELVRSSGEKPSSKSSKSVTLHKSAQFIRNLKNDRVKLHAEMESLKKEIQVLQDDLNLLQANLPVSGCVPQIRPKTDFMFDMYNEFVRTRTQSNWKFWIFGQLMRPIYESYIHSLSSVFVANLGQAIKYWLDQHCSLAVLRPAYSNELREICKKTSLINNPSKLPQEALEAVGCPTIILKPDCPN